MRELSRRAALEASLERSNYWRRPISRSAFEVAIAVRGWITCDIPSVRCRHDEEAGWSGAHRFPLCVVHSSGRIEFDGDVSIVEFNAFLFREVYFGKRISRSEIPGRKHSVSSFLPEHARTGILNHNLTSSGRLLLPGHRTPVLKNPPGSPK